MPRCLGPHNSKLLNPPSAGCSWRAHSLFAFWTSDDAKVVFLRLSIVVQALYLCISKWRIIFFLIQKVFEKYPSEKYYHPLNSPHNSCNTSSYLFSANYNVRFLRKRLSEFRTRIFMVVVALSCLGKIPSEWFMPFMGGSILNAYSAQDFKILGS